MSDRASLIIAMACGVVALGIFVWLMRSNESSTCAHEVSVYDSGCP